MKVDMYVHLGVNTLTPNGVVEDIHYAVAWGVTLEEAHKTIPQHINQVMDNISEGIHPSRVQIVHAEMMPAIELKVPGVPM